MGDQETNFSRLDGSTWPNWIRPDGVDYLRANGFHDSCYGNDACPSWTNDELDLQVFVDLPIGYSEVTNKPEEYRQYTVINASLYGEAESLLETNDFSEIIKMVEAIRRGHD